jgi:hypothetical protein
VSQIDAATFAEQSILGELKEEIQNQVLMDSTTEPGELVKAAYEIESILNEKKRDRGFHVISFHGLEDEEGEKLTKKKWLTSIWSMKCEIKALIS